MRIALLAPFEEPVPPEKYGGTERVVYVLAEGLVRLGHDVTLFASGDSSTSARLVACTDKALRSYLKLPRTWMFLQWHGFQVITEGLGLGQFDVVHNHGDWPYLTASAFTKAPFVTTIHNPKQFKLGVKTLYRRYPYISISDAQRRYVPELNYVATVHHGIDVRRFTYNPKPDGYLAFLGRIHPDKGLEQAIAIAKATNSRLIIAAKLDPALRPYYERAVKPHLGDQISYIGEVDHAGKVELLKNARAMLNPIQWDEPFGLTNIEAMACGTPVLAIGRGALPEIIMNGVTGYLCQTTNELIARVGDIGKLDRAACRKHVEEHFSAECMAQNYVNVYERLIQSAQAEEPR